VPEINTGVMIRAVLIELFILKYSIELLIEYSSTRLIPEVAINYTVGQK